MSEAMNHRIAGGLRALADWLDEHPKVELFESEPYFALSAVDSKENAVRIARALGQCTKDIGPSTLTLTRSFEGVRVGLVFWRSTVCERRVVGTREVPERVTPAHVEEIVEWDCHSILGQQGEPIEQAATALEVADEVPF